MTRIITALAALLAGFGMAVAIAAGTGVLTGPVSCTLAGKTYAAGTTFAVGGNGDATTPYAGTGTAYVCSAQGRFQHL